MSSSGQYNRPTPPLTTVAGSDYVAGSGPPPHDPGMEARVTAIESRLDRIEVKIDKFDERLRSVETGISALDAKMTLLADKIVSKLPSWWQMPTAAVGTIAALGALVALAQRLHIFGAQ